MKKIVMLFVVIYVCSVPLIGMGYMHSDEKIVQLNKEYDDIQRTLNGFSKNLSGELVAKYKILRSALSIYANAHADNESNSPGTGWADARAYHEKAILKNFIDYFKKLESQQMSAHSDLDFKNKDVELNRLYQSIQKNKNFDTGEAAATSRLGIKNTQRSWIKYRDVWVSFAILKFPSVDTHSLKTNLTADRITILAKINTD